MQPYNKLVRDKIPEMLDAKGISYEKRVASEEEYKIELIKNFSKKQLSLLRLETLKN